MGEALVGGPMFEQSSDEFRRSVHGRRGGHYNTFELRDADAGLLFLKQLFPDGKANDLNFVLFSTSGIHGSYIRLEEIEDGLRMYPDGPPNEDDAYDNGWMGNTVTVLVVQPRLATLTFGEARVTLADLPYLYALRESSWAAAQTIGRGR